MSDASQSINSTRPRPLRQEEADVISQLLSLSASKSRLMEGLPSARVLDMKDGKMGSIQFLKPGTRVFGCVLAEAQYSDADGTCVSIALNADQNGDLFELDFWKVDFSPLKQYPKPTDLQLSPEIGPEFGGNRAPNRHTS